MVDLSVLKEKDVYIYPFDDDAKKLVMYLADQEIFVKGFLSDDVKHAGKKYLGKQILPINAIDTNKDYFIVGCKSDKNVFINKNKVINIELPASISYNLAAYRGDNNQDNQFFSPHILNYLLTHVMDKRFVLCGKVEDIVRLCRRLKLIGLTVDYGISVSGETGYVDDCYFRSVYDLLYENIEDVFVWVLFGSEEYIRDFIEETSISEDIFCCTLIHKIYRTICFDPNMGLNNSYKENGGIYGIGKEDGNITVAVLGGSTSDSSLYIEKSWPECLYDIAQIKGLDIKIINGAVSGHTASQELVKLERDIIPQSPDIVISYSRVNELQGEEYNHFVHRYQKDLYERIVHLFKDEKRDGGYMSPQVSYSAGYDSWGRHWLAQEMMMHAICESFGIRFLAIIQPFLFDKKPFSSKDEELLFYLVEDYEEYRSAQNEIYGYVRQFVDKYDWLIDLSGVFNGFDSEIYRDIVHVNEFGNQIIADRLFSIMRDKKYI